MRGVTTTCLFIAAVGSCGSDEHVVDANAVDDAVVADAVVDGEPAVFCNMVPSQGMLCTPAQPYCCLPCLECGEVCESEFGPVCTEHPVDGVATDCDTVTGAGCTGGRPVCCSDGEDTYCSDHPYRGGNWTCSGPDASMQ